MTVHRNVTAARLDELRRHLTQLDWQILDDVSRFRLISTLQLQQLHFGNESKDERRCQRQLAQLGDQAVLDRLPRRVGGRGRGSDSTVYRVGRAGRRLLRIEGTAGPSWQPSAAFAAHTLGIADLYVDLVRAQRHGRIALIEFTPEPEAWRSFTWKMKPVTLKPDAFTRIGIGGGEHHYFIELDLGTESMKVIERKIGRYLDYYQSRPDLAVFPQVLFLVDSRASYHSRNTLGRVEQIEAVAEAVLPGELRQLVTVHAKNHPPWSRSLAA